MDLVWEQAGKKDSGDRVKIHKWTRYAALFMAFASYKMSADTSKYIHTPQGFYKFLDANDDAVVMFYNSKSKKAKSFERFFGQLSEIFKKTNVQFAVIDISKKELSSLDDTFERKNLPVIVFFQDGAPARGKAGGIALISGSMDMNKAKAYVNAFRKKDSAPRTETRRVVKRTYYSSPSYYSYPYYGYYGWPYGGYYGWGWGWGGGYWRGRRGWYGRRW